MSTVYCEGLLWKRQRGLHASNTKRLKFQERFCRLTPTSLDYYDPNPKKRGDGPKGQFAVKSMRVIELTTPGIFGREYAHTFQVGDQAEVMYFAAKSQSEKDTWLKSFRKVAVDSGNSLLPYCHRGVFGLVNKGRWSCCANPQRTCHGCSPVTPHDPSAVVEPSILSPTKEDRSKSLNFDLDDPGMVPSSYHEPSSSPLAEHLPVRSFTMSQPRHIAGTVLQKLKEKRRTMDFDSSPDHEKTESCDDGEEQREEEELEVHKKGEALLVQQDILLPAYLSKSDDPKLGELNKMAEELHSKSRSGTESPSSVADSGRGTSTSSSRPASLVSDNAHSIENRRPPPIDLSPVPKDQESNTLKRKSPVDEPDGGQLVQSSKSTTSEDALTPTEKEDKEIKFEEDETTPSKRGTLVATDKNSFDVFEDSPVLPRKVATPTHTDPVGQITGDNQRPASVIGEPNTPLHQHRPKSMFVPAQETPEVNLLHSACQDGNLSLLMEELNAEGVNLEEPSSGPHPHTPLHIAFRNDHFQVMVCLLERGANPNTEDPTAKTTVLHSACANGCLEMVELLLKYNANVNGEDFHGVSPLLEACRNSHLEVASLLLKSGAHVNHEGAQLRTALHEVALTGNAALTELLLKNRADTVPRDSDDLTPFDIAFSKEHLEVMHILRAVMPAAVRPYSLLRSESIPSRQYVTDLIFRGSETLISGSRDSHATFWDTSNLSLTRCLKLFDTVLSLSLWSHYLALGSTSIQLCDLENIDRRRTIADDSVEDESLEHPPLHLVAFGPKGGLATAGVESNVVKLWPSPSSKSGIITTPKAKITVAKEKNTPSCVYSITMSPTPNYPWMAVGVQPGEVFNPVENKLVYLIDLESRSIMHIFDAGDGGLSVSVHCMFTPNGLLLAIGCLHNLCIWDCKSGELLYKFTVPQGATITSLCFSPDGSHLATGLSSGEVQVFAIDCHGSLFRLKRPMYPSPVTAIAYSDDGRLFSTGHQNGDLQLWESFVGQHSND